MIIVAKHISRLTSLLKQNQGKTAFLFKNAVTESIQAVMILLVKLRCSNLTLIIYTSAQNY